MRIKLGLIICIVAENVSANQWSLITGVEEFSMQEKATNGSLLVNEKGWLPFIGVQYIENLGSHTPVLRMKLNVSSAEIDYDGRLQSGQPYQTQTDTTRYGWNLAYRPPLNRPYSDQSLWLGLGTDYWQRKILPRFDIAGLDEDYRSNYVNLEWQKQLSFGFVKLGYAYHFDSELALHLPGYQVPKISLPSSHQGDIELGYSVFDNLNIMSRYSIRSIQRSKDYSIQRNGFLAGTIAQPKHIIQILSFNLEYKF